MIGFIYVRDIPKIIVSLVVAVLLLWGVVGGALSIPGFPELVRRAPEWVDLAIVLLLFWASMVAGNYIWELIDYHLPDSPRRSRHVSEVMELYKHSIAADVAARSQHQESAQRLPESNSAEEK